MSAPPTHPSISAVVTRLALLVPAFAAGTYPVIDLLGRSRLAELAPGTPVASAMDGWVLPGLLFVALGLPFLAPWAGRPVTARWPELPHGADLGFLAAATGILAGTFAAVWWWPPVPFPAARPEAWFAWSLALVVPLLVLAGHLWLARTVVADVDGRRARLRLLTELSAGPGRVHVGVVDDVAQRGHPDDDVVLVRLQLRFPDAPGPLAARTTGLRIVRERVPRPGDRVCLLVDDRSPGDVSRMLLSLAADPTLYRPYLDHRRPIEAVSW